MVPRLGINDVGLYQARLSVDGQVWSSRNAELQLTDFPVNVKGAFGMAKDKFVDAVEAPLVQIRVDGEPIPDAVPKEGFSASLAFSSYAAQTEASEPHHARQIGGASKWVLFQAPLSSSILLTTKGSDFPTVLSVYRGTGDRLDQLELIAEDIKGNFRDTESAVKVDVEGGKAYYIAVDGVKGQSGLVRLNINFRPPQQIDDKARLLVVDFDETVELNAADFGLDGQQFWWELNGQRVPQQMGNTLIIDQISPQDAGVYRIAVQTPTGIVRSGEIKLELSLDDLQLQDNFFVQDGLTPINTQEAGIGIGENTDATRQPDEPLHARKRGVSSMWFHWEPPTGGIATFATAGSNFDTLLAVYTGDSLADLANGVVTFDDEGGGFHTSRVRFNAQEGETYRIAIDGAGRSRGRIILQWEMVKTSRTTDRLPQFTRFPEPALGRPGRRQRMLAEFDAPPGSTVEWFRNGESIGVMGAEFTIEDLRADQAGKYQALVRTPEGRKILLPPINVQMNVTNVDEWEEVETMDRFADLVEDAKAVVQGQAIRPLSGPARGFTGTQIFNTFGATKEDGEPDHCGVPGGASEWFAYQPQTDGALAVNTNDSDFDTVIAVYTGPGTDFESLTEVACDDNSGADGMDSAVTFPVVKDTFYYIAIDGVDVITEV